MLVYLFSLAIILKLMDRLVRVFFAQSDQHLPEKIYGPIISVVLKNNPDP